MFSLFLSTILAAAPIPKSNNEGQIGFIIGSKMGGKDDKLVLLAPSGKEIKRVDLTVKCENYLFTKLSLNDEFAIVTTAGKETVLMGNVNYFRFSGILQPLDGKSKSETLFNEKCISAWVFNRSASQMIVSEYDKDKMVNMKPGERATKSWIYDIKSKKQESIPLPSTHFPVDITADGSTLLTCTKSNDKTHIAFAPTSTWKPVILSDSVEIPLCISPDGEKLLLSLYPHPEASSEYRQMFIHNLKTKRRIPLTIHNELPISNSFAFSPDGQRIAIVGIASEKTANGKDIVYKLFTYNSDGTGFKLLFKSQPGEYIAGLDWR